MIAAAHRSRGWIDKEGSTELENLLDDEDLDARLPTASLHTYAGMPLAWELMGLGDGWGE